MNSAAPSPPGQEQRIVRNVRDDTAVLRDHQEGIGLFSRKKCFRRTFGGNAVRSAKRSPRTGCLDPSNTVCEVSSDERWGTHSASSLTSARNAIAAHTFTSTICPKGA